MENELKILILEDIAEEATMIERAIRKDKIQFSSRRVDTRDDFVQCLETLKPDVVLSDHALPQFNSIEALKLCREFAPSMPFILVTGTVSEEFAVTCLKQGADDYVLKSNLSRLPAAIRNALHHRETIEMKKAAEDEIKHQNEQLIVANSALHKINTELDKFVYSVSHNLRGPISSILGVINLAKLEDENKQDKSPLYFDMIHTSINKLDDTIREILHYSQNARIELKPEPVDIEKVFQNCLRKLKYLSDVSFIDISLDIANPVILSDAYRLSIILENLLSNSIKYCAHEKPRQVIRFTSRTVGPRTILTLSDNGIGINSEVLPLVYNMFYRGTERSDGAGLGLYIAREAVEKLGGTIAIASQEHTGTTVTVELPELIPGNGFNRL